MDAFTRPSAHWYAARVVLLNGEHVADAIGDSACVATLRALALEHGLNLGRASGLELSLLSIRCG